MHEYVSSFSTYQRFNYCSVSPADKLIPIQVTDTLKSVGLDLIGSYPISNRERQRYVLVIVIISKWVEFVPFIKASARAVADAFFDNFVSKYGAPVKIVSDNGPWFVSDFFKTLCAKLVNCHA